MISIWNEIFGYTDWYEERKLHNETCASPSSGHAIAFHFQFQSVFLRVVPTYSRYIAKQHWASLDLIEGTQNNCFSIRYCLRFVASSLMCSLIDSYFKCCQDGKRKKREKGALLGIFHCCVHGYLDTVLPIASSRRES